MAYQRKIVEEVKKGLEKAPGLIHVVVGPRQVGKTTAMRDLCESGLMPHYWVAADMALPVGAEWLESHWQMAEAEARQRPGPFLLVVDEVQKVRGWSETVKRLWDRSRAEKSLLRVVLLGSSALLVQAGLTESLHGRFFLHRCMHWSFSEMKESFGWDLNKWLYFGGYPGAAVFSDDERQWRQYVADAMVETVLARDVFQLATISKPILMRHLFSLAARFPAQILSYNKMLGQLLDAGNTTTLAHYLKLLEAAFLVSGLELYSAGHLRRRGSSPKLIFWNDALIHALSGYTYSQMQTDTTWYGRVLENAVGAHLLNHLPTPEWSVTYWRDGIKEMDFVVTHGHQTWGIEVKSGTPRNMSGLVAFHKAYPDARVLVIGAEGIDPERFFSCSPELLLR